MELEGVLTLHPLKGKVDIDIALDDMLGSQFADRLNSWLKRHGQRQHHVAIISRNPEKSKHLETATMRIGEIWIDFVNLRTESYTDESRIPQMGIGTPQEDAYRRDLTINSLFYNIRTGLVEDYSGLGLDDIRGGVIRTPLQALTTLLDDPLRVLRAIRLVDTSGAHLCRYWCLTWLLQFCQPIWLCDGRRADGSRQRLSSTRCLSTEGGVCARS
jgi:tRNA nucleotidyltransferase/poly(A) polymerase